MDENLKKLLEKQQYRFSGNHSVVKICRWTKKSLVEGKVCYKEKWYPPVKSHRCMQMSPSLVCNHRCLFCWRLHSGDRGFSWKESFEGLVLDEPKDILEKCIEQRKSLLTGFKGFERVDKRKWEEALKPNMMAISLTGEPTMYPKLDELIQEAKRMNIISFLVTNGTLPDRLQSLNTKPFQLYVTLPAPNKETYKKLCQPSTPKLWDKIMETLELIDSFDCRKVIRLTLVKGLNMVEPEEYAKLIEKANPDFVEAKGYVHVGESQKRLPMDAMPYHEDIIEFSKEIEKHSSFRIKDVFKPSRVVLLKK
ncbi:MAG: 4-demethylwyosine synthase TYW1 [Candidatus Aenigmarchaeota archaeon CG_4_10_14_0_8_um_filter_37_24]|nr:4-demethylwyosine synthase TYW1 [Candidatus Aenigmarchaeota archaeon]PIV69243.1 MAG: 4-demethylwyosine synthase TYW1 [Candidatus Aenigmarchaeota archaeon CG01_land_8_20_14_3_00_37_9]PIW41513.1 MAG: 4-demethylwyosine synthase TYW1 [Candidatus Aenigmarchaeota archaeon CG15_BIG_FIL_POST_REV_8_21_14_020_37_27]PIX51057.1 MAG: 4-demethylwyosine synthase TYW1 [Candidatus Aenigmarchaeota archaeon CG_4_8_14_3_um_filter_37_24]PIY35866.1 MAG: 4-demethylwyosine synthase TYW1 [Candidatus Aenigmarchaeota 